MPRYRKARWSYEGDTMSRAIPLDVWCSDVACLQLWALQFEAWLEWKPWKIGWSPLKLAMFAPFYISHNNIGRIWGPYVPWLNFMWYIDTRRVYILHWGTMVKPWQFWTPWIHCRCQDFARSCGFCGSCGSCGTTRTWRWSSWSQWLVQFWWFS
jgi:hypothetical protein